MNNVIVAELVKVAAKLDEDGEYELGDEVDTIIEAFAVKKKPVKRKDFVFPPDHKLVKDHAGHFPLGSENQSRNALARASQYSSPPKWYRGTLQSLVNAVRRAVKAKYPGIKLTDKSKKPGKG